MDDSPLVRKRELGYRGDALLPCSKSPETAKFVVFDIAPGEWMRQHAYFSQVFGTTLANSSNTTLFRKQMFHEREYGDRGMSARTSLTAHPRC